MVDSKAMEMVVSVEMEADVAVVLRAEMAVWQVESRALVVTQVEQAEKRLTHVAPPQPTTAPMGAAPRSGAVGCIRASDASEAKSCWGAGGAGRERAIRLTYSTRAAVFHGRLRWGSWFRSWSWS